MTKPDSSPITIMLVDDHFVVRSGLAASLDLEDDLDIVAEAESGETALELWSRHRPQVVVMDMQLPGISGLETTRRLVETDPDCHVLIFSTWARDDEIRTTLEAGALGYLQKSASRDELISAIRMVASGGRWLPAGLDDQSGEPTVTQREREILALVAQGRANKEIASELGIAEDTVKRHVSNILQKFAVNDRAQATAEAIRRGIVSVDG